MNRGRRKASAKQKWTTKNVAGGVLVTCNVTSSLAQLNDWRKNGLLCDVTIKAGDRVTIPAHRNILAVSSEYFHAMFTSGLQESSSELVKMEAVSGELLAQVIDFMYTGELRVEVETAQELLMLTDMLQMEGLKLQCEQFMMRHLEANNCLGMVEFGRKYSCGLLVEKAFNLIKKRFPVVALSEEFQQLPLDVLTEIVKTPDLHLGVQGENCVLTAVMLWVEAEPSVRCLHLPHLLPLLDLPSVSDTYLGTVRNKAILSDHTDVIQLLQKDGNKSKTGIRAPQQHIYAIGGYFQSRTGPSCPRTDGVERFYVQTQEWSSVAPLPILPSAVYAFNLQGRLLVIAFDYHPQDSSTATRGVFEYNYLEDIWVDITTCMDSKILTLCEQALQATGAITYCSTHQYLYLLTEDSFFRAAVEETDGDIVIERFEQLPSLQTLDEDDSEHRHEDDMSLVPHNGLVFAFGGTVRKSLMDYWPSDNVSCYDPEVKNWVPRTAMLSSRAKVGAVSRAGKLYTVGGFGKYRENCMERYDPDSDTWEDVASMEKRRSHFCVVTAAGKIWALGGKSYAFGCGGARKVLKTVESYDPEKDRWTTYGPMKEARCGFAAVVL